MPCPPSENLPNPGTEPRSLVLQADSLPSEPPGKPKNTGVDCHALLQGIFPTQGLNPGLLHCRRILYLPSHQGRPRTLEWVAYPFSRESSLIQKSNQGLLHCRWIPHQLSYYCCCCCCCLVASQRPHRLPCPWDSPGKNTRVGCHFLHLLGKPLYVYIYICMYT